MKACHKCDSHCGFFQVSECTRLVHILLFLSQSLWLCTPGWPLNLILLLQPLQCGIIVVATTPSPHIPLWDGWVCTAARAWPLQSQFYDQGAFSHSVGNAAPWSIIPVSR
jgi:hypothetical protein